MDKKIKAAVSTILTLSMIPPEVYIGKGYDGQRKDRRYSRKGKTHDTLKTLGLTKQRKY